MLDGHVCAMECRYQRVCDTCSSAESKYRCPRCARRSCRWGPFQSNHTNILVEMVSTRSFCLVVWHAFRSTSRPMSATGRETALGLRLYPISQTPNYSAVRRVSLLLCLIVHAYLWSRDPSAPLQIITFWKMSVGSLVLLAETEWLTATIINRGVKTDRCAEYS